jgi:predicted TIM-barrel fold metal-dependent hydrolase
VEISNLTGPAFEIALQQVGPERLIFGSFLPVGDPLVPLGMILDAELSEDGRGLVAGGNLRRLIGGGQR